MAGISVIWNTADRPAFSGLLAQKTCVSDGMILLELRREGGRQKTFEIFLDTLKHNLFLIPEIAVSTMDQVYGDLVFPLGICQHECL